MPVPAYYVAQVRAEKQASARPPASDRDLRGATREALRAEPDPSVPAGAVFGLGWAARRVAPFVLLLGLASGCSRRPEPPRPAYPPQAEGEGRSAFLEDVVPRLAALCPYTAPVFSFDELAGVRHVAFKGCEPLQRIQKGPKVKRARPARDEAVAAAEARP